MKKLFLLIGLSMLFSPLVHAGQYDGKWEGKIESCNINSKNFSASYKLTIKNDYATMHQYNRNSKNEIHKGKVYGFTKKNKLGLNGRLGHISGKFTSSNTLLFKYDDSENCSVRMAKITKFTNTDTVKKNTVYCQNKYNASLNFKRDGRCYDNENKITKYQYDTQTAKITKKSTTYCKKSNGEIYETNRGYCLSNERVVMESDTIKRTPEKQAVTVEPKIYADKNSIKLQKELENLLNETNEIKISTISKDENNWITKKTTSEKPAITKQNAEQTVIVESDTTGPQIIVSKTFVASQNLTVNIKGRVDDDSKIVSLTIDGDQVALIKGKFSQTLYVLHNGQDVEIVAIDKFGNQSKTTVALRRAVVQKQTVSFAKLNPLAIKAPLNNNAVALIIGVEDYENTYEAKYAKQDALFFNDFAHQAFGVPRYNIKLLINDSARRNDALLQIATWLPKIIKENKTDFYLFFSGHGLANDNGEDLFLLPYDGYPAILEDSALLRNKIFENIANLSPRSVTVFLDTCYSGATRSNEMLVAARPVMIEVQEQSIPNNFTVFSASANNEIASVFKEAEHGLFSYFLMKGLEGEADENGDEQITNGELITFINKNVSRQANQTPQLAGDASRVLVQW